MNVIKFYKPERSSEGRSVRIVKVRISQGRNGRSYPAEIENRMMSMGFTRRRPTPPHYWREQQPGYRQPTAQAVRRASQTLRAAGRKAA